MIEIEGLTKRYGQSTVVDGVKQAGGQPVRRLIEFTHVR